MKALLVGGGNITNLRHIPALRKLGIGIIGIAGTDPSSLNALHEKFGWRTYCLTDGRNLRTTVEDLGKDEITFAIVGTPPHTHFEIAKQLVSQGIDTIVEKPFTLHESEGRALATLANDSGAKLGVMHNFANSRSSLKAQAIIESGRFGKLRHIHLIQLSSMSRRIPQWIDQLPGGLFFDEAAHFVYLAERFGGRIRQETVSAQSQGSSSASTPSFISAQMQTSRDVNVAIQITFDSPISEWGVTLVLETGLIHIDLFRDIITVLRDDGDHRAKDILRTSASATWQHMAGFASSGFLLVSGNLHYGIDKTIQGFLRGTPNHASAEDGIRTVSLMNEILRASS